MSEALAYEEDEVPVTPGRVNLPEAFGSIFSGNYRWRVAYGGRGSGKSRGFATMCLLRGYEWGTAGIKGTILCAREFKASIKNSSLGELKAVLDMYPWLAEYYDVGENYIKSIDGNIEFIFAGLKVNLEGIPSTARLLLAWVDEAEAVSESAWRRLDPTVRVDGSEIWVSFNPESPHSATAQRFLHDPSDDMTVSRINYDDNPWFPEVLENSRKIYLQKHPDTYSHVWEGDYLEFKEGSYYTRQFNTLKIGGRICHVPHRPDLEVVTAWDLGVGEGDHLCIWFFQHVEGGNIHVIDSYSDDKGLGYNHYANVLKQKSNELGYTYERHILPHDGRKREQSSGKRQADLLQELGIAPIDFAPGPRDPSVAEGIEAVRQVLPLCMFDKVKCERGIQALQSYHREFDELNGTWRSRPKHDWASHFADAFRYYAIGYDRNAADSYGGYEFNAPLPKVATGIEFHSSKPKRK